MEKKLLSEYIDACELIKETEKDIQKLENKKKIIVQSNVKGSNPNFPYEEKHFHFEGSTSSYHDDLQLRYEKKLLEDRKAYAERIKLRVETAMNTAPIRIQRIIRLKFFKEESWDSVAKHLGRKATADSVRMELERFLKEK